MGQEPPPGGGTAEDLENPPLDSDGDGLADDWEITHFADLSRDGRGDADGDGLSEAQEFALGLDPRVDDAYADADGDRYPNIFEVMHGSDPNGAASQPSADILVDIVAGNLNPNDNIHDDLQDALTAAASVGQNHQIIGVEAGTYLGVRNRSLTFAATSPRLLVIGLRGAARTIVDAENTAGQWLLQNRSAFGSLTLRRSSSSSPIAISGTAASGTLLSDLVLRDNAASAALNGLVNVNQAQGVMLLGSTLMNSRGATADSVAISISAAARLFIRGSIIHNPALPAEFFSTGNARAEADFSLVRTNAIGGESNLRAVDPLLRVDGRLLPGSPARGQGGVPQTRLDWDLEARPAAGADIGADQFVDSDGDGLADQFEIEATGSLGTLGSAPEDFDEDGLTNGEEYGAFTDPTRPDSDADGLVDGDESLAGTDARVSDSDGDGLLDGVEVAARLDPTRDDASDDADGDRYPNIFELTHGSDVNSLSSVPSPDQLLDLARAGQSANDNIHDDLQDALTAATTVGQQYQIIGVEAGTYVGVRNRSLTFGATAPRLLVIGLRGAARTVIDAEGATGQWLLQNRTALSSLTLRNSSSNSPISISGLPSSGSRLADLVLRDNVTPTLLNGVVNVNQARDVRLSSSTVINNRGTTADSVAISLNAGARLSLDHVVLYNPAIPDELFSTANARVTAQHSLVRGDVIGGQANLPDADPELRADGRLLPGSPLRGRAGNVESRLDMDLEPRPEVASDIGADQFADSDADELSDQFELETAGTLTTLAGALEDFDDDGRSNGEEYEEFTSPVAPDSDGDGLLDGEELFAGTDPRRPDSDGDGLLDGFEVDAELEPTRDDAYDDADGDRYPNIFEQTHGSDVNAATSVPRLDQIVDLVRANQSPNDNIHDDIQDALTAAASAQNYQIIGVEAGTFTGSRNCNVTFAATAPRFLVIGLRGAQRTIVDAEAAAGQWLIANRTAVASLTLRNSTSGSPIQIAGAAASGARLVDLVIRDNAAPATLNGVVNVSQAQDVRLTGSTLFNNRGVNADSVALSLSAGARLSIRSSIVFDFALRDELFVTGNAQASADNSLIRSGAVTGFDNVDASDPLLRSDGRLLPGSPARRGGARAGSHFDMHLEPRPDSGIDIGADQFVDADGDGLADSWELEFSASLATLAGSDQDFDADGLANGAEFERFATPTDPDSDDDSVLDGTEIAAGTDVRSSDTDRDDVPDGVELRSGTNPIVDDAYDDADGDRFPNVFEFGHGTDLARGTSVPAADHVINSATGGASATDNVYADVQGAISAASALGRNYQIIVIDPGTYRGAGNVNVNLAPTAPRLLLLGRTGAASVILDGGGTAGQITVQNRSAIASLTLRSFVAASPLQIIGLSATRTRLIDLVMTGNSSNGASSGVLAVTQATGVSVVNSSIFDNVGANGASGLAVLGGASVLLDSTILFNPSLASEVFRSGNSSAEARHSLVRGDVITGTDNLPSVDPELTPEGRLVPTSPVRGRGALVQSRFDMDLEERPADATDIGADQWTDADDDGLEDVWERSFVDSLEPLTDAGDFEADGLPDTLEYLLGSDPTRRDTDGDSIPDGEELLFGLDPTLPDVANLDTDVNGDGIDDSVGLELGIALSDLDADDDGLSNGEEIARGTDPLQADTDADGVLDPDDPLPRDGAITELPEDPDDSAPPTIELLTPTAAEPL